MRYNTRMKASSHRDTETSAFRETVRLWMKDTKTSYSDLAERLHLATGTVQNWFCKQSGPPITAKNRRAIEAIMKGPVHTSMHPCSIRLKKECAHLPLWTEAAISTHPDSSKPRTNKEYDERIATWATSVIMNAVSSVFQPQDRDFLVKRSREMHSAIYPGQSCLSEDTGVDLPIMEGAYRPLLVAMASSIANKDENEFIAEALDAAATEVLCAALDSLLAND